MTDLDIIDRCFQLAEQGRGLTRSNPLVGAVLVYNQHIISEGYHAEYGGPHAEVNCLSRIEDKDILKKSALYISLEPCNYYGKTPACTDYILKKGIQKVVIGSSDFNFKVRNQGMDYLRSQEVEVINLHLEERQKKVNISFFINQTESEPYFIGKLAMSSDKIIGREGEITKITTREVDALSHKLRTEADAIIVGKNTWLNDKPKLDARYYSNDYQPDIIVLSNQNLDLENTTIDTRKILELKSQGSPEELKKKLFELGYRNILVEGGAEVFRYFMENSIFHEIRTIENQSIRLENGIIAPEINYKTYRLHSQKEYFNQQIKRYYRYDLPNT